MRMTFEGVYRAVNKQPDYPARHKILTALERQCVKKAKVFPSGVVCPVCGYEYDRGTIKRYHLQEFYCQVCGQRLKAEGL